MHSATVKPSKGEEQADCERHFQETHRRQSDGRFIVKLPFKTDVNCLGRSMEQALSRFLSLERKLQRDPTLHKLYTEFMQEYIDLGHMSLLSDTVAAPGQYFYIPHHAVFKASSTTTKLRVVFDASMKSSNNRSLNDVLMTGPVIQNDLFDIVIKFRMHLYVITADVAKMYRQVLIDQPDRHFQRILWRDDPNKPLNHYVLNTVTYGTTPASFLASRVLKELALINSVQYPEASFSILNDFYVDDYLSGADSIDKAKQMYEKVSKILEGGGMHLRKWCSNSQELREHFSNASHECHYSLELNEDLIVSSLGLIWCPISDELKFNSNGRLGRSARTKRDLLSTLNSVFDPLGFLGPVLIRGKIFLQEMWQLNLGWDDLLPKRLQEGWIAFVQELEGLNNFGIPRSVKYTHDGVLELHGFCDASTSAYGACIYVRQQVGANSWSTRLLCAKSRVAPTKTLTVPRLELSGALLLAELMNRIVKVLNFENSNNVYCWCDSTVVLSWIHSTPARWKTYVANRITQILEAVGNEVWRHVPTTCNPADPLSRGIDVETLLSSDIWWFGPAFLSGAEEGWPIRSEINVTSREVSSEQRPVKFTLTTSVRKDNVLLERYSSWSKLLRVTAIWKRFIAWLRHRSNSTSPQPATGSLTVAELDEARYLWVKIAQQQAYAAEVKELLKGNSIAKGPLKKLSPFLDNEVLRVGGRLENSKEIFSRKHPVVLPPKHRVTELIFKAFHLKFLHIGPQGLLANVRVHYWPLRGRELARATVHKCVTCFRAKPIPLQPPMGQLPAERVTVSRPFAYTGVDFAGPLMIRAGLRKGTLIRSYVSVFVCLTTKAIHLELVSNLTADAFMACLRRFSSRRGLPSQIWSDNATNFIGVRRELRRYFDAQRNGRTVPDDLVSDGVQWRFIPPAAPHFGGIWEAAVKSFKHHLVRTTLGAHLNFEELCTLLTQIEACLNSRPLMALSNDPADYNVLTPNHFLIGGESQAIPDPDFSEIFSNRLRKWQVIQKMYQDLWKRWRREYLSTLLERSKWTKNTNNIKLNTLAILMEDNAPPLKWTLVRIVRVHPGTDNIVRVVTVRTSAGHELKRPVVKICPLPIEDNQN